MQHRANFALALAVCALVALAPAAPASADVQPGDRITTANADQVKDLVSPGMFWCVQHGFPMDIVAPSEIKLRKAFLEATEKYSSQVQLGEDGLSLKNFVAGRPFPNVTADDPQAAAKIMQNYSFAIAFDDLDIRNFDADTGPISMDRPLQVERHFLAEHFMRLFYVGRLYVDPKPVLPNDEGYHFKETLKPLIEPFDLKGVGFTYYRYMDPQRQDDSWLYLPSLRRVRRLSTAQRSDALFGQDTDQDSYGGYAGAIAWMDWKLIGEKDVLGSYHAKNFPVKWAEGAADWAFESQWEKRKVWVIEGISKLPQYAYSKRVLYVDQYLYTIPYSDMYDRGGQLWKIWINHFKFGKEPFAGSPITYDEDTPFLPGIVMVDMQLEHATKASTPSHRFPGEPGFYWHMGDAGHVTEEKFTIAELIASGR
jgi:hypothetical protein